MNWQKDINNIISKKFGNYQKLLPVHSVHSPPENYEPMQMIDDIDIVMLDTKDMSLTGKKRNRNFDIIIENEYRITYNRSITINDTKSVISAYTEYLSNYNIYSLNSTRPIHSICMKCGANFPSRNKLFRHLEELNHYDTDICDELMSMNIKRRKNDTEIFLEETSNRRNFKFQ